MTVCLCDYMQRFLFLVESSLWGSFINFYSSAEKQDILYKTLIVVYYDLFNLSFLLNKKYFLIVSLSYAFKSTSFALFQIYFLDYKYSTSYAIFIYSNIFSPKILLIFISRCKITTKSLIIFRFWCSVRYNFVQLLFLNQELVASSYI